MPLRHSAERVRSVEQVDRRACFEIHRDVRRVGGDRGSRPRSVRPRGRRRRGCRLRRQAQAKEGMRNSLSGFDVVEYYSIPQ